MKKISILALVLALTMAMSVSVSASKGFYNIGTATDVTIVPEANGTAVTTATEVDIDLAVDEEQNKANETLYDGSNGLDVTLANASSGSYYGVLLIEGSTLPTVDDDIHYIDQVTADGTSVNFNVLPIIPTKGEDETANGVPMTLYISSNATDAKLVSVPLNYAYEGEYAPVSTAPANDYITSADTTKGTINTDVKAVTAAAMGQLNGKFVASLALDTTAYPNAGNATAGYIVKAVAADGTDIEGAEVLYSAERKKYVAAIPSTVTDYKFEVLAADAEGATANAVINMYADFTNDGKILLPDYMQFANIYKSKAPTGTIKNALIADVTGDGVVTLPDYMQFANAYKGKPYNFLVLTK